MKVSFDTFLNWSLGISFVLAVLAYALRCFYEARNPPATKQQCANSHAADQPHGAKETTDGPQDIHPI